MNKVFNLTNKYIILATPLILFSLISSIYLTFSAAGKIINLIIAIVLFTLMLGAFIAGWGNMIKQAVQDSYDTDSNALIKEFTPGVGEYFLPALGSIFVMAVVSIIILAVSYFAGMKGIGDPGISSDAFSKAMESADALKLFLTSLTAEQLAKLNLWNLLLLGTIGLTYFILILYLPAIFFKNKNPFVAFFISLKDLFSKNFGKTLLVYAAVISVNFVLSIAAAIFAGNLIFHFLVTLINFYYIVFAGMGIFYYYHKTFVETHLGKNIDETV